MKFTYLIPALLALASSVTAQFEGAEFVDELAAREIFEVQDIGTRNFEKTISDHVIRSLQHVRSVSADHLDLVERSLDAVLERRDLGECLANCRSIWGANIAKCQECANHCASIWMGSGTSSKAPGSPKAGSKSPKKK